MMTGRKPNLTGIQRFGAAAYVKLENAGKLKKRASKARFVGYDNESKGYRIYWPEKHAVSIERNVVFNPGDSFEESVEIMNEEEQNKRLRKHQKFRWKTRVIKIRTKIKTEIHYLRIQPHWTFLQP